MDLDSSSDDFVAFAVNTWRKALRSLGSSEIDERQAFSTQILEKLLGYDHTLGDYQIEERGTYTDIAVYDKDRNKVVVIETKRSDISIDKKSVEDQAFSYADTFTRYVATCNLKKFKLYKNDNNRTLLINVDFYTIITRGKTIDKLKKEILVSEYESIDRIRYISKNEIYDDTIFDDFLSSYQVTNIDDSNKFMDLIKTIEKCISYIYGYALRAYTEYENKLEYYDMNIKDINEKLKLAKNVEDDKLINKLRVEIYEINRFNQNYIFFRNNYNVWKDTSTRTYKNNDDYKKAFCSEAAFVLLNKILFIRICEDKNLLPKKISNGGVELWKKFTEYLKDNYKDLLYIAYSDASHLYDHIYQQGIFDFYQFGNSELNDILKRVFWNLNHFNFENLDKDILGNIYERYLSPDQRKELGEFYTPNEIVTFILDNIFYKSNNQEIRGKKLIDIGCGSGGFLVEALNRIIVACDSSGIPEKNTLLTAIDNIYGLDIDHFAVHICEMNLAFRIVDMYKNVKDKNPHFSLPRINIYQTDSLKLPQQGIQSKLYSSESIYHYLREQETVEKIKSQKYQYVVGNPPYVTKQLNKDDREYYNETYRKSINGRFNLYRLFIHRASMLLEEGGILGFIVPNTWIADTYATAFRKFLKENFKILMVVPLPEKAKAFYKVTQATTILLLEKNTKSKGNYSFKLASKEIENIQKLDEIIFTDRKINEVSFGETESYKFVISPFESTYDFIKKMNKQVEYLEDVTEKIHSGEIRQVEVRDDLFYEETENTFPVIHGDNIDLFYIDLDQKRRDAMWYKPPLDRLHRDNHSTRNRIVMQRIANMRLVKRIKTALLSPIDTPVYVENGANYILLNNKKKEYPPDYLIGLLNSSTLNYYFKLFSSSNNIQPSELKRMPIKKPNKTNENIIKSIVKSVSEIRKLKYELNKDKNILRNPLKLVKEYHSIYNSSIIKFPSSNLKGEIQLNRKDNVVYITITDYFECESEIQAKCVEILISQITDLSEIQSLTIPKNKEDIKTFVNDYYKAKNNVNLNPSKIREIENNLDCYVYKLYNISSHEISLIEPTQ